MKTDAFPAWLDRIAELTPQQRGRVLLALTGEMPTRLRAAIPPSGPNQCPHCAAQSPTRHGHIHGQQRWRCGVCKRTFGASTGTPLKSLHRKFEWRRFVQAMGEGLSVAQAAERCGIHRATAARWRHRLEALPPAPLTQNLTATDRLSMPDGTESKRPDNVDPRILRTQQALHRALLKLIGAKPLEQLTIRDIATEARIGYATFFRHYDSKEDLLEELASGQLAGLVAVILPLVEGSNPFRAAAALCQYVSQNRALWAVLLSGGARAVLQREFIGYAQAHGLLRESGSMPVDLGSIHGVSATLEILTWWLRRADHYAPEQVADFIHRLVVTPLMTGSTPRMNALIGSHPAREASQL